MTFVRKWRLKTRGKNEEILRGIEISAVLLGVIFMIWQIRLAVVEIEEVRSMQSSQIMFSLDRDISSGRNAEIAVAIENDAPLFKETGGAFSEAEIDAFLSILEFVNLTRNEGLLDDEMTYVSFSYILEKTFEHPEILDYVEKIRKDDPNLFKGAEDLAKIIPEFYN